LQLARRLSLALNARLVFSKTTRLLVELNRTLGHPRIFSEFSRQLAEPSRCELLAKHYAPYRRAVTEEISRCVRSGPVLHLSVHSFTPVMNARTRRTDVGLLFDPARDFETRVCRAWRKTLKAALGDRTVHFNLPYRGTSDGFTVALRKQFADACYAGIELEINQKFPLGPLPAWRRMQRDIVSSFQEAVAGLGLPPGS
jgi:predicted N-formylglutamate amidohydrolase